jgi:hypothetical protein
VGGNFGRSERDSQVRGAAIRHAGAEVPDGTIARASLSVKRPLLLY